MNKRIIIEIDGVHHELKQSQRNEDCCTKQKCSLFRECQVAPVGMCVPFYPTGYHFEKEQTQGAPANT